VAAGSAVDLTVASGNAKVPDVLGDSEDVARSKLENAGFSVKVSEQESADAEVGAVISQTPKSGASQRLDSSVSIVIAKAPAKPEPTQTTSPRQTPTPTETATEEPAPPPTSDAR
jgi:serine/threonine-protein kinase